MSKKHKPSDDIVWDEAINFLPRWEPTVTDAQIREVNQSIAILTGIVIKDQENMTQAIQCMNMITEWMSKVDETLNNLEAWAISLGAIELPEPRDTRKGLGIVPEGADTHVTPRPRQSSNKPRPDASWVGAELPHLEAPRPSRYAKPLGLCRLLLDLVGALGIGGIFAWLYMLIHG